MTDNSPLCLEQINFFLPFFDLEFQDWETKWQASFMTRAESISGWPLNYLDRERYKVQLERWNKEHKEQKGASLSAERRRGKEGVAGYNGAGEESQSREAI